jgi:PAS domain S-box-containing protein
MKIKPDNKILLNSERKYKALFENAPIGISIVDSERNIIEANPSLKKITRISDEGIKNGLYKKRKYLYSDGSEVFPDDLPNMISLREKRPVKDVEIGVVDENNETFWVQVSVAPLDDEGKFGVVITSDITERKILQKKLGESDEQYRQLTDNCGLGIGYYSLDGKIIMFNQKAIENMGGKPSDYIGKSLTDVFGKEMGQIYTDRIKIVSETEEPVQFEDYAELKGKPGWYLSTHVRILNKSGKVDGIQVIADNITESKTAEEKLRTSESEFRSLFENSIMGISQVGPSGNIIRINKALSEMYGYADTSTMLNDLSQNVSLLYNSPEAWKKVFETLEKSGSYGPAETELKQRNGEKFWALVGSKQVRDNTGKLLYLQTEHIDISSQKKLEAERYLASFYARNLIEASLDPLVTINAEGKITDVNAATVEITGISREELTGSDFADYFADSDKARKGYKTVFSKGKVKDYPLTIIHSSGRKIDVLYNATLFENKAGEVQGVFAAARDITEIKKMESELRNSKRLLEKLNQHLQEVRENERSQIALNLHDDLGQRLTALYLDLAWLKSRIGVQSLAVREKIEVMSLMINETIEGIKEISSFLRPAILYDFGLITAITSLLNKFENQSGIKCYLYYDPDEYKFDKRISLILYRIIQESLTNVARHSKASSLEVRLSLLQSRIKLSVKDNGIGIDNGKVNSMTSLGIAGIKERVRSVNGRVSVKGKKGSGTSLNISIPLNNNSNNDQSTYHR